MMYECVYGANECLSVCIYVCIYVCERVWYGIWCKCGVTVTTWDAMFYIP